VLDDIVALRQWKPEVAGGDAVHLFAPQTAVRFRWNRNTDTPLPPEIPAGQNPPDGAIVEYSLPASSNAEVKLEIFDAENRLVRRYASTDKPKSMEKIAAENPIPMYWVRPQQILSAEAGFHRFVWDLHYPPPDSLTHEFPIAAIYRNTPELPLGVFALPGRYSVKLTVDGKTYTQPLTLKMDPRIKRPDSELRAQFKMETGAVRGMNESFKALAQLKSVQEQLAERSKVSSGPLADALAAVHKKVAELEGGVQSDFFGVPAAGKQPESFSTLNQRFGTLLAVADSADAAPTSQAETAYREEEKALQERQQQWSAIRDHDIAQLNLQLAKEGQSRIDLEEPPRSQPSTVSEGDDEP
jgi:hypothetical protein